MTQIENARRARAGAVSSKAGGFFTTYNSRTSCKTQLLAGPRFERQISHIIALGERPLAELLAEIAAVTGQHVRVVDLVEEYAALDPAVLRALGADSFAPTPLEVVR